MTIISRLQLLGLSEDEAKVYLALHSIKKGSVLRVAQKAGVKRPTAYLILEDLEKKNLARPTEFRGFKEYRSQSPEHLKKYIQKQQSLMREQLPKMTELYNKHPRKRLRVYDNISSVKTLLEKSLREKSMLHVIGEEEDFREYLGAYWSFYLKRAAQSGILPKYKSSSHSITLLLFSDKIAFIKFCQNIRVFAFKNPELHHLYQNLWNNF